MTSEEKFFFSTEYCKARRPECLEMCTIFFQKPYKAYSFTLQKSKKVKELAHAGGAVEQTLCQGVVEEAFTV